MTNEIQHYNDKADFSGIIAPLEQMFTELTSDQRDVYYNLLSGKDRGLLRKAVNLLLSEHEYKRFPLDREIRNALRKVKSLEMKGRGNNFQHLKETSDCNICRGTGFELFEKSYSDTDRKYTTARHCLCPIGKYLRETVMKRPSNLA